MEDFSLLIFLPVFSGIFFLIFVGAVFLYHRLDKLSAENLKKFSTRRRIIYMIASIIAFVEFLPISINSRIYANRNVNMLIEFIIWYVTFGLILFGAVFCIVNFRKQTLKFRHFVEALLIPILLFSLFIYTSPALIELRTDALLYLNRNKAIEKFINPFPGIAMNDCREFSDNYDVIFMPAKFSIERNFLFYKKDKSDKANIYYVKDFGDGWYLGSSGSAWGDDLRNCHWQREVTF